MTNVIAEKLNHIFTADFLEANMNISTIDSLYEKVFELDNSICRSDFDEYVGVISEKMHAVDELDVENLDEVAGGFGWSTAVAIAAGIKAATDLISFSYKAGKAVGEAIYNFRHK